VKVQSTGLGKTVMSAELGNLQRAEFEGETSLMVTMESSEPLHWTIKVYLHPRDVRRVVLLGLRPSIIWRGLLGLVLGRFSLFGKGSARPEAARESDAADPEPAGSHDEPRTRDPEPASGGLGLLAKFKE
jgi:hypothetical protein